MNSNNEYATPKLEVVSIETQDIIRCSTEGGEVSPWSMNQFGG